MKFIGAKLFPKQQEIVNAITGTPVVQKSVAWHLVNCSRQFGKSFMLKQLLLYYAINEPNSKVLFVSMTHQQAGKVFNEILRAIKKSPLVAEKNAVEHSLILVNGSEIYIRSYQRCDFIRGLSANTLIIDEAAFIREEDFQAVLRPTLSTAGKRAILFSTPRGKNYFYDMCMRGESVEWPMYRYYHATYRDNPIANLSEIDDAKKTLPDKIFRSEYEAEFVSGSLSVFTNVDRCVYSGVRRPSGVCIAGLDIGRQDDSTALTIMSGDTVVLQRTWRQNTWSNIINEVVKCLKEYQVKTVHVEINGVGDPVFEMLQQACSVQRCSTGITPWLTSNTSKQNAVEKLINDFNEGAIHIPDDKELRLQLDNFEAEYSTKSHSIKYGGRYPIHDDRVMSLAICNYNRLNAPTCSYHISGTSSRNIRHN